MSFNTVFVPTPHVARTMRTVDDDRRDATSGSWPAGSAPMTLETLRRICVALPGVTEDVKWGQDLCFLVGGKMFVVVNLEPPHQMSFKCLPETFAELIEREGLIPAPYLARNMWVQEQQLGETLERRELEPLIKTSYELVVAKLPTSRRPSTAGYSEAAAAALHDAKARRGGTNKRSTRKRTAPKRTAPKRTARKRAARKRSQ